MENDKKSILKLFFNRIVVITSYIINEFRNNGILKFKLKFGISDLKNE